MKKVMNHAMNLGWFPVKLASEGEIIMAIVLSEGYFTLLLQLGLQLRLFRPINVKIYQTFTARTVLWVLAKLYRPLSAGWSSFFMFFHNVIPKDSRKIQVWEL